MTMLNNHTSAKTDAAPKAAKRTVAEKLAVVERLRDLQKALAPVREANKAKRAAGKIEIRIKTR